LLSFIIIPLNNTFQINYNLKIIEMKMKYIFFSFFLLVIYINSNAQISFGGAPASFDHPVLKSIPVFNTPDFDYEQMLREDEANKGGAKPYRFGKTHFVNINPENSGEWTTLSSGDKVWMLQIHSKGAYSIGLFFDNFHLNKGVRLFVYSSDKSVVKGAFTEKNNKTNNTFVIGSTPGENIIIELDVPAKMNYGTIELSGITHAYKDIFGKSINNTTSSGSCNVNVNCPEGDEWQNEKRAVVRYEFNGYLCSGALINNTRNDGTPYLLTANHCISSQSSAQNAVFYFNYESELCDGTTGPLDQTVSVADLIATPADGSLDFSLLKLSVEPPAEYNVYYAGWNRSTAPAKNTTCIHHPQGDIKKITFDYDPPVTGNYGSGYVTNSHWNIIEWDLGTTEPGSSGSPLFDENHRIVGNLTGGEASCSYNYNDYYAKFDMSWDYYDDPNQQLKAWLDPDNTGAISFPSDSIDIQLTDIIFPTGDFCLTSKITPEIKITNLGLKEITSFGINYNINSENTQYYNWSGHLPSGNSINLQLPEISAASGAGSFKVYTSSPNEEIDENPQNDTLTTSFQADTIISNLLIKGSEFICTEELTGEYFTDYSGKCIWSITGGEGSIIAPNRVAVTWNSWGNRQIDLTLSNTCGDFEAEPIQVIPVEQSITLNISTQNNPVKYYISNTYNEIVFSGEIQENSGNVSLPACLMTGCYTLYLEGTNNCSSCSYSVTDENDNVLVSGTFSGNTLSSSFCAEDKENAIYNIYPNPAKDKITIEANFIEAYENAAFSIYTLNGAKKIPENKLKEATSVDISELRNGYYLIKIRSDYGEFTKSFIKQ